MQFDLGSVLRNLVGVEFEQFFFGEEDYRFIKDFELRTVFVDCFLLAITLLESLAERFQMNLECMPLEFV